MTKEVFTQLNNILIEYCSESIHDMLHVYRVLSFVLDIAQNEKEIVDMDILITATLLHDIAREEERLDPSVCHAKRGAELSEKILSEFSYTSVQISHVQECIRTHRFRGVERPESIEAKILFDADKLDATGCIGIARTLMYKGIIGEPLYSFDMDSLAIDYDSPSFIREYNFKLSKIGQQLYTKRALELWEMRNSHAHKFYEELLFEIQEISVLKNFREKLN